MGYARVETPLPAEGLGSTTRQPGYTFKLCPYSTQYRNSFTFTNFIYGFDSNGDPLRESTNVVIGNTTNESLYGLAESTYPCSDHTTTSGRMEYHSNPPGWICRDLSCYYATTVVSGGCYIES
jgi:hypothetical protein